MSQGWWNIGRDFDRDCPDGSSQARKSIAQSSIDRKRGHSSRSGGLGCAARCIRDHVRVQSGERRRPFGKWGGPGARRFNPAAAMPQGVMSVLASAAGRTLTLAEHIYVRRLTEGSDTAELAIRECRILAEAVEELQRPKEIEIMIQFSAPH